MNDEQFVTNILGKASGKELRTIALVPKTISPDQLERLTEKGIRFVTTDVKALLAAKDASQAERIGFQLNTYSIMLLLRRIDASITPESSLYRLLRFYVNTHFALPESMTAEDYIKALLNNEVVKLIKACLAYRPIAPYDSKELKDRYDGVAKAMIAA